MRWVIIDKYIEVRIENIWEQLSKHLKSFIEKRVNNEADADDILQNVFYKIHKNIGGLNQSGKIHSWVYTIARNSIIDYYRTKKLDKNMLELTDDIEEKIEDGSRLNEEIAQCLKAMIMSLPEKYKEAIILTEYQNFTQKELSEKMGLSLSGAKSRVQRARKMLKSMFLSCCQIEFDRRGNIIDYKHNSSNCKFC